ncbi:kinase-like protein [Mycena polygramma]|nr:kinase-like protein [Mycena polygramma]
MLRLLKSARDNLLLRVPGRAAHRLHSTITIDRAAACPPQIFNATELHQIVPGDVLNGRYKALRNIGTGRYSTVCVHDVKSLNSVDWVRAQQHVALKVLASPLTDEKRGPDELGIMIILRDGTSRSPGKNHIPKLLDSFIHHGPNGRHVCLVLELLGISILDVYRSFGGSLPLLLVQRAAKHILRALQYIHECDVIHTDIKGDNILMTGLEFAEAQSSINVEPEDLLRATYKLTDFGSANKMSRQWAAVIQPVALRSPEVLIDAPWDTKTDIWNFGCLMYEFAREQRDRDDHTQTHLAQMVGLLGEFPEAFIAQGKKSRDYFDDSGHLIRAGSYGITLMDLLSQGDHEADELPPAVDFLSRALTINPYDRWSAAQLLEHPWMDIVEF